MNARTRYFKVFERELKKYRPFMATVIRMELEKTTGQLWMVKINGKTFRSNKGKYTWTSEGRALAAVANYVSYYDYQLGRHSNEVFIIDVIKELVKNGYIKTVKVY